MRLLNYVEDVEMREHWPSFMQARPDICMDAGVLRVNLITDGEPI